jgi:ACS family glucarate transporter-like MFS transporter
LFQLPGGWLADRWGARLVLTGGLIWWSFCTALTAFAAASPLAEMLGIVGALMLVRFTLGLGEAVALPSFNRVVANWMTPQSRGIGIGIAIGGIGLGSAITPPLAAWIMVNWGWQTVFYLSAGLGLLMGLLWWMLARDHPAEHPWIRYSIAPSTPGGRSDGVHPPFHASLLQNPTIWWLVLSYSCLGYVAYVYLSWFYLYLVNVRGFDALHGGLYASAPFWAILIGCPLGGLATDRLAVAYGVTRGRLLTGMSGMVCAGLAITAGAYAGALSGLMNTGANLGGALSPTLTPWMALHWGWPLALAVAGAVALMGAVLWIWIDPGKGLTRHQ